MKKNEISAGNDGELFAKVPDTDEIKNIQPINTNADSESRIEGEAIASLPLGEGEVSLESLLVDTDEHIEAYETPEEAARYEQFLADYKNLMTEMLENAKAERTASTEDKSADVEVKEASEADVNEDVSADIKAEANTTDEAKAESTDVEAEEASEADVAEDASADVEVTKPDEANDDEDENPEESDAGALQIEDGLFNDEIVEKSRRINPEDHIRLVDEPEEMSEAVEAAEGDNTEENSDAYGDDSENAEEPTQLQIDFGDGENDAPEAEDAQPKRNVNKYDADRPRRIDSIFEFVELFIFTLLAVMIVSTFFFRQSVVDGDSMKTTLSNGDRLIIWNFMYQPDYGDIIVFEDYSTGEKKPLVKRVIGLPGDKIEITDSGDVYRNGQLLDEDYIFLDGRILPPKIKSCTVGEGEVFVMGDHRNDSKDSRELGPIDIDGILGKVIFRFYPFAKLGGVD